MHHIHAIPGTTKKYHLFFSFLKYTFLWRKIVEDVDIQWMKYKVGELFYVWAYVWMSVCKCVCERERGRYGGEGERRKCERWNIHGWQKFLFAIETTIQLRMVFDENKCTHKQVGLEKEEMVRRFKKIHREMVARKSFDTLVVCVTLSTSVVRF